MADRGRPSTYTQEVAEAICARIAEGESLASICRDDGMPPASTVRGWVTDDVDGFAARSARAYATGYDAIAESCIEIADDGTNDWMERKNSQGVVIGWEVNGEHIQRSRIRIDTRLRLLGKWAPKRYGDKVAVGGAEDLPPIQTADPLELARGVAFLLQKGAASG